MLFLILYFMAAVFVMTAFFLTIREKGGKTRRKKAERLFLLMTGCILAYSVNFLTDRYEWMSAGTSICLILEDLVLIACLDFFMEFTGLKNRLSAWCLRGALVFAALDAVLFLYNIFHEVVIQYSMNLVADGYVLGYDGAMTWFYWHGLFLCILMALSIAVLLVKCHRIPREYHGRYMSIVAILVLEVFLKYLFLYRSLDIRVDLSVLLFGVAGLWFYWTVFEYSKKQMLYRTHGMMLDYMETPVALFDYEDILTDFNRAMDQVMVQQQLSRCLDQEEGSLQNFLQQAALPLQAENRINEEFHWKHADRTYQGKRILLQDAKGRFLGTMLELQDVTEITGMYERLRSATDATVDALTQVMLEKDQSNDISVQYIRALDMQYAKEAEMSDEDSRQLLMAATLHNIGKMSISAEILQKKDKLSKEELQEIRTYTERGYRIAAASPELRGVAEAIRFQHERWDGQGYPLKKRGTGIPALARILAVLEAYEAMVKGRPYRPAVSSRQALQELEKNAGTQFDPEVTAVFTAMIRKQEDRQHEV